MVIVAGHITVEPQQRESYLAGCVSVVDRPGADLRHAVGETHGPALPRHEVATRGWCEGGYLEAGSNYINTADHYGNGLKALEGGCE